jgi:hypothetical protein
MAQESLESSTLRYSAVDSPRENVRLLKDVRKRIKGLTIRERIGAAQAKIERIVDHLLYILELHENVEIVVYSQTLSSQIPLSYAANAFNVFRHGLHQFEIVRLCALWDGVDLAKENIPIVIELVDHPDLIEELAQVAAAQWNGQSGSILNASPDPDLRALELETLRQANMEFGLQEAERTRHEMQKAIDDSRNLLISPKLVSMMNLRDKQLAHSLTETRREKAGPIDMMKYGDEREILNATLPIVQALHCWVNGKGFSFDTSREYDRKNAKALWEACTFNITR